MARPEPLLDGRDRALGDVRVWVTDRWDAFPRLAGMLQSIDGVVLRSFAITERTKFATSP